ncbi:MAG TPA: 3-deoxy-7-phosphoheptulonate synthase class II [Polyangiaceae bacterium]|nr:3-deoxy-7-phosphoheptulonate synthase class II [Polyangiaceae bacterium]
MPPWTPDSWKSKVDAQAIAYGDAGALERACTRLRQLPPLVTSWEIERLKQLLADAQQGRRFLVQGGDCAETVADCRSQVIANKLKILLQMSLVMIHEGKRPVIRVGRFAGQYAKPRTKATESREGVSHPSYFGDMVNRADFTESGRRPDPENMILAYSHAAMTLNFIRSLSAAGFADVHHPEYWELSFFRRARVPDSLLQEYEHTTHHLAEALRFMEALGESTVEELTRVEFYTSHEGLNLHYESAQTRQVPRREGWYDLTTHFPWIGERTRALDGAHVEFFRGIRNPIAIKLGPTTTADQVLRLIDIINPHDELGKVALVTRMGASRVADALPGLVDVVKRSGRTVLWVCDPMHGNTQAAPSGIKTRDFDHILREVETTVDVHDACGTYLGGVHFELTGEDVTECIGGAAGITVDDLDKNYATACDPRLNYRQALEMGFRLAKRLGRHPLPAPRESARSVGVDHPTGPSEVPPR